MVFASTQQFYIRIRTQAGAPGKASGQSLSCHNDVCGGCIGQIVWCERCVTHDCGRKGSSCVFGKRSQCLGVLDHFLSGHGSVEEDSSHHEGVVVDPSVYVEKNSSSPGGNDDRPNQAGDGVL